MIPDREKGPDLPLGPDIPDLGQVLAGPEMATMANDEGSVPDLCLILAGLKAAVVTVPVLAERTGWGQDRVADLIVEAVAAGELVEWPENEAGPGVMLAHPHRHGLRLAVLGEAESLAWTWELVDAPEHGPRWKADRDRRRKTTRTMGEGAAVAAGWERPLDSIPDPHGYDPAAIAEHREALEVAIRSGSDLRPLLPASPRGNPAKAPGRLAKRRPGGRLEGILVVAPRGLQRALRRPPRPGRRRGAGDHPCPQAGAARVPGSTPWGPAPRRRR